MITALAWISIFLVPVLAILGLRWVDRQLGGEDWGQSHRKYAEQFFNPKKEDTSESA
jgi:hypothetical protein